MQDQHKPKIALVIGAGGIKSAAAIGVQKVLEQAGIGIDLFVGCSGGSIFAAFLAMGCSPEIAIKRTQRLWTKEITRIKNHKGYLMTVFPSQGDFSKDFGLRDDRLIMERLHRAFGNTRFENLKRPLYINATDFETGEPAIFERGRVVDAIRASIAIPSLFKPWSIGGRSYVDGVISNPIPIDIAARAGADIIIAVGFESPYRPLIRSATQFSMHVSSILTNNLMQAMMKAFHAEYNANIVLLQPKFDQHIGLFDPAKIPLVAEAGERATEECLSHLFELICHKKCWPAPETHGRDCSPIPVYPLLDEQVAFVF